MSQKVKREAELKKKLESIWDSDVFKESKKSHTRSLSEN